MINNLFPRSLGLLVLCLSISGAEEAVYQANLPLPVEHLMYSVKWGLVKAGTSSLSITGIDSIGGVPAYHIVSEARSATVIDAFYKVRDRSDAWMDTRTPRSLGYSRDIHEGQYRIKETVQLNQEKHEYVLDSYRADRDRHEHHQGGIPANVFDILSSLYYVRTLPLEAGKSFTIDVHSGEKVYPLLVQVKKRTKVHVHAGTFDCWLVEPILRDPGIFVSKGKKLEVWMTADARHLPVLMRSEIFIGHVSAELLQADEASALTQRSTLVPPKS